MPAITITDLNNAKSDVDHIAAIATSTAPTAIDRIGNVKRTMQGAVDTIAAFNNRGAWVTATVYAVKDLVSNAGTWYVCVVAHTSSAAFATDTASKWRVYQGVSVADLAAPTGASFIGGANQVVASIAALRTLLKTSASKNAFVTGYYAAADGGGGPYLLDVADTTTADNGGSVIVAADGGRWRLVVTGSVSLRQFGAKPDGVTNASPALAAARSFASPLGLKIYAPAGTYKFNTASASGENLLLEGDGPGTIFDFTGAAVGDYALSADGTATLIQFLASSPAVGAHTITFLSAPSLSVGDVFVIQNPTTYSWSGFRSNYFAGEWCEVESISGNIVTLKNPLYDSYVAGVVNLYRITSPKVVLRDFEIRGTTIEGLIKPTLCISPLIENVKASHANDSIIYFDRCFKPTVNNPDLTNVGDGGDDYGIAISNSQHARINGGYVYSRRHAVTHGGGVGVCSVPVRDSRVRGTILKNDINSGTEAADFHGNTEDSSYEGCVIYNGANLQGKDNKYVNCKITHALSGYCVYHSEVKGGRLALEGCELHTSTNPQPGSRGIIDIGGSNDAVSIWTTLPTTFVANDCTVNGRNLSALTSFMIFRNAGSAAKMNFEIDGITANVNAIGTVLRTSRDAGTAASDFVVVDNLKNFPAGTSLHTAVGSFYLAFPHRLQKQSGRVTLSAVSGTAITIAAQITLKYAYPRPPVAHVTAVGDYNVNRLTYAGIFTLTETAIRPLIESGDATNWTGTAARDVMWTTHVDEV